MHRWPLFFLLGTVWLLSQHLPPRWGSENALYQADQAINEGAFSAARVFSSQYETYYPTFTPALPPSDLPAWWENYSRYDLLREGSERLP